MTVKDLKLLIQDLPDNTPIIGGVYDHTYRDLEVNVVNVIVEDRGQYILDYDEQKCLAGEYKTKAVLFD